MRQLRPADSDQSSETSISLASGSGSSFEVVLEDPPCPLLVPVFSSPCMFITHAAVLVCISAYFVFLIASATLEVQSTAFGIREYFTILHFSVGGTRCGKLFQFVWPVMPISLLACECYMRRILTGKELSNMISTGDMEAMLKLRENLRQRVKYCMCFTFVLVFCIMIALVIWPRWLLACVRLGIPACLLYLRAVLISVVCIDGVIAAICENDVRDFMHTLGKPTTKIDWPSRTRDHQKLDDRLAELWGQAAVVLMVGLCVSGLVAFCCLIGGVISYRFHQPLTGLGFFVTTTIICVTTLVVLQPLAAITCMCRGLKNDSKSIINVAAEHAGEKMSLEARCEYNSFMLYLERTPIGADLPLIGPIDYTFLASKATTIAKAIPLAITIFVGIAGVHKASVQTGT